MASFLNPKEAKICKRCDYYRDSMSSDPGCTRPEAPFTDFVTGKKEPEKINKGNCQFFSKK